MYNYIKPCHYIKTTYNYMYTSIDFLVVVSEHLKFRFPTLKAALLSLAVHPSFLSKKMTHPPYAWFLVGHGVP